MGNHYGGTRTNKPCQKCGRMMYNVPIARKCCNVCTYGFPCADEDRPPKPQRKGPTLEEIMREADKEGLQYASYCKKHGLY